MMKEEIRRLAAIMFTDMVGYTALVQENEQKAREFRDRHRLVLGEGVKRYNGKVLQFYGDGTLSVFPSAVQSVKSAIWIQRELGGEPRIPLRIGLHIGDIIDEKDSVFGDGVNVASRVQTLASSGSVLISERVFDEIRNQSDLHAVALGEFQLKNVRQPMEIYAVSAEGLHVPDARRIGSPENRVKRSVAVLPFMNMSADRENEYFSDGISEEIINALTRIDGLHVTARTSSFAFKGSNRDVREIGRELDVGTVLEGSVRKAGSRIRITAQLINTRDGFHAWSEVYDRRLEDVFEVQDEISRKIASKLRVHLSGGARNEQPATVPSRNMDAYTLYLKGVYHWNKWNPTDSRKAIEKLQEATVLDPEFAQAYAYQAACYTYLGALGQLAPTTAFPIAKELTQKAFDCGGKIAEAYLAQGVIFMLYDWEWDDAGVSLRKALEISPGNTLCRHMYSFYLALTGEPDEGVKEMEIAHGLDPLSLITNNALADSYFSARRYHDALVQYKRTIELDPGFRAAKNGLGWVYLEMGETDKAIEILEATQKEIGDELKGWTQLGYAYAVAGRRDDALECIRKLELRQKRDEDAELSVDFAIIYEGLGDRDKVFECLGSAVENRNGSVAWMRTHPGWTGIRSDPRFKELLRKIRVET